MRASPVTGIRNDILIDLLFAEKPFFIKLPERASRSIRCVAMSRYTKHPKPSPETRDEAMTIARATQRPGQTKEQTKLIAQGIQKGIDQYKKEYKSKLRELDRQRRKLSGKQPDADMQVADEPRYRQHWLPWLLLAISWIAVAIYLVSAAH